MTIDNVANACNLTVVYIIIERNLKKFGGKT